MDSRQNVARGLWDSDRFGFVFGVRLTQNGQFGEPEQLLLLQEGNEQETGKTGDEGLD